MSPSETIVGKAAETRSTVDTLGRRLTIRSLTALDKLRILKAAGPDLALNQPWLAMAILASSVTVIDDIPVPQPSSEIQIEALVGRLGDSGIEAIAQALETLSEGDQSEQVKQAGNLFGTPI
jgi:hypothetical protein